MEFFQPLTNFYSFPVLKIFAKIFVRRLDNFIDKHELLSNQ